ncbi:NAD(P)/FAD-dependent oxidoreductase [bacterium]|jgi:uncharacterized FAD-dependent dehydrogenase|nr:NAD(P)/FAD-dependent oxidoreductase [bacterium]
MERNYDVIIVGAGPMGMFTAYELVLKMPDLKILLIDKGLDIYQRGCPLMSGKVERCPKDKNDNSGCQPSCSITTGFGGGGAYSDGKFNITSEFGGWLTDYLPESEVLELINYVDAINLKHGAPTKVTQPNTEKIYEIEKKGIAVGLKLLRSKVRHLGTEVNLKVLESIFEFLKQRLDFSFCSTVTDVLVNNGVCYGVKLEDETTINAKYVVLGVGRPGSDWLCKTLRRYGVKFKNNRVDVGVRVETNNIIMDEINQNLYEGKFIYRTSDGTQVRTFCSNPSGHVVVENYDGVMLCNGHSYNSKKLGSENTNFALLVSYEFNDPFKDPNQYGKEIGRVANRLANGSVIVQKYGDILRSRRSTQKRIEEGYVKPTLKEAVPGDLTLILPYKTMKALIEMINALNTITPGIANDHTLFYGVEAKFYSARVAVDKNFQTVIKNLYVGGDGAGLTRGLSQAGANGIKVARAIIAAQK